MQRIPSAGPPVRRSFRSVVCGGHLLGARLSGWPIAGRQVLQQSSSAHIPHAWELIRGPFSRYRCTASLEGSLARTFRSIFVPRLDRLTCSATDNRRAGKESRCGRRENAGCAIVSPRKLGAVVHGSSFLVPCALFLIVPGMRKPVGSCSPRRPSPCQLHLQLCQSKVIGRPGSASTCDMRALSASQREGTVCPVRRSYSSLWCSVPS